MTRTQIRTCLVALLAAPMSACSSSPLEAPREASGPDQSGDAGQYFVKAYVGPEKSEYRFGPPGARPSSTQAKLETGRTRETLSVDSHGAALTVDGKDPAQLLARAAAHCAAQEPLVEGVAFDAAGIPVVVDRPPWYWQNELAGQWWVFESGASLSGEIDSGLVSCDRQLFAKSVALCTASELASLADSVGPTTWPQVDTEICKTDVGNASLCDEWELPPVSAQSRFILRNCSRG